MNRSARNRITLISLLCLFVVALMLPISGCDKQQKLTPQQLVELGTQVETLTSQLTTYQAMVTQLAKDLQANGVLNEDDAAKVVELNSEIDRVKAQIIPIAAAIKTGDYSADDDMIITILKAAQAANAATVAFNPYAGYISIGLGAIIFILTMFAKKKAAEVVVAKSTLRSVANAIEGADPTTQESIKSVVAENLKVAGVTLEGKKLISEVKAA